MEDDQNTGSVSDEQKKKILSYLQQLYSKMKELIEQTRTKIKENEDEFDHITNCLQEFKEKSTLTLIDLSLKNFNEHIKLEDNVFEWSKIFKQDLEVYPTL